MAARVCSGVFRLYVALLLVLFALFFRPVGFKYRNKLESPRWRRNWDRGLLSAASCRHSCSASRSVTCCSVFRFSSTVTCGVLYGTFWGLLNAFSLLAGVVSLALLIMHGAAYLQLRTDGIIQARAARAARLASLILIVTFGAAGIWVAMGVDGYRVISMPDPNSLINPLAKSVMRVRGAWLENYIRFPLMLAAPVAAFAGALGVVLLATLRRPLVTLLASATSVTGVILTAGLSMFRS